MTELTLHSPAGSSPLVFEWSETDIKACNRVISSILHIVKYTCEEIPLLKRKNLFCQHSNSKSDHFTKLQSLCNNFNAAIDSIREENRPVVNCSPRQSDDEILSQILRAVYDVAVTEPSRLNRYKPFSAATYGETSFATVRLLHAHLAMSRGDVFVDLGSGVGHVVLQTAAATPSRLSYGIELAAVPAAYAAVMSGHFRRLMMWHGRRHGHYRLLRGDFLHEEHRDKIDKATVIFVNNLMFSPELDNILADRFKKLRDGTRIVSTRSYGERKDRLTERNSEGIGAVVNVTPIEGTGLWTSRPVTYYVHTIDRSRLEGFREQRGERKKRRTQIM